MVIGLEKFNLLRFYKSYWEKVVENPKTKICLGDFVSMPFSSNSFNRIVGLYGIFSYGTQSLGEDFGVTLQIKELCRLAKSNAKCRVTLNPLLYQEIYTSDSLFVVTDPLTQKHCTLPILRFFKEAHISYQQVGRIIKEFGEFYPPAFELTFEQED